MSFDSDPFPYFIVGFCLRGFQVPCYEVKESKTWFEQHNKSC